MIPIFQQDPSRLNLFLQRHYFQSIFSGIINLSPSTDALFIGLSDDGACLNFGRHGWFQAHGIPACGQWSGKIKTLSHIVDICTPFYKLQAKTRYGDYVPLFVLGTEDIGYKKGAPVEVLDAIAKLFDVPPDQSCSGIQKARSTCF